MLQEEELSYRIRGPIIEVHKHTGPGMLESGYEQCLCHEFTLCELPFMRQVPIPIKYKGILLDCGYRADIIVAGKVLLELKSVERVDDIHRAQLLPYLKLSGIKIGYLVNFNVIRVIDGIERFVL